MKIDFLSMPLKDTLGFLSNSDISITFSQEGEDLLLEEMFVGKSGAPGFYVDVGAHHPQRFSNTCAFYLRGWHGINIDATPGSMEPFRQARARDINLEIGIAETEAALEFFLFNEPALNTFDRKRVEFLHSSTPYRVQRSKIVNTYPLSKVLDEHCPPDQLIDFLNVDAEGLDLAVIYSNDWTRYRPRVVILEDHSANLLTLADSVSCQFMTTVCYVPVAKLPRSIIFHDTLKL